eukprot:710552-Rhodomonas_salina.1
MEAAYSQQSSDRPSDGITTHSASTQDEIQYHSEINSEPHVLQSGKQRFQSRCAVPTHAASAVRFLPEVLLPPARYLRARARASPLHVQYHSCAPTPCAAAMLKRAFRAGRAHQRAFHYSESTPQPQPHHSTPRWQKASELRRPQLPVVMHFPAAVASSFRQQSQLLFFQLAAAHPVVQGGQDFVCALAARCLEPEHAHDEGPPHVHFRARVARGCGAVLMSAGHADVVVQFEAAPHVLSALRYGPRLRHAGGHCDARARVQVHEDAHNNFTCQVRQAHWLLVLVSVAKRCCGD